VQCKSYHSIPITVHKTWFPLAQIAMPEDMFFVIFVTLQ